MGKMSRHKHLQMITAVILCKKFHVSGVFDADWFHPSQIWFFSFWMVSIPAQMCFCVMCIPAVNEKVLLGFQRLELLVQYMALLVLKWMVSSFKIQFILLVMYRGLFEA